MSINNVKYVLWNAKQKHFGGLYGKFVGEKPDITAQNALAIMAAGRKKPWR